MSQKNMFEVDINDLFYILRNSVDRYVVLAIVTPETNDHIRIMIRKYIKTKSKMFPHVTFLYFVLQKKDCGRASFLTNNLHDYPKLCHIYNVDNMMIDISAIDNVDIMEKSFTKLAPYYAKQSQELNIDSQQFDSQQNDSQHIDTQQQVNPIVEQKKLLEKLTLLRDKAEEYTLDFLEECRKRKKEEEKKKKKEASK